MKDGERYEGTRFALVHEGGQPIHIYSRATGKEYADQLGAAEELLNEIEAGNDPEGHGDICRAYIEKLREEMGELTAKTPSSIS